MAPLALPIGLLGLGLIAWKGPIVLKDRANAPVQELTQGASYAVTCELTSIGSSDLSAAAEYLRNFYMTAGFDVLSTPTPKDSGEATHFVRNEPSAWVLNARWLQPGKYVKQSAPNIPMAIFQPLPVS